MKAKIYTIVLCYFLSLSLFAQPINKILDDVVMPSAEALSGAKYGDIPVSYFTGVPNIGIDLHTIQEGSLQIPLALSYHASGVKLGEINSWVGNWSLQLGMLSRTTMGIPDDLGAGYYWNNANLLAPMLPNNLMSRLQMEEAAEGTLDTEPDLFHASLPGYGNVKFLFDKNKNVIQLPKTDFKIEVHTEQSNSGRFLRFTITSPTGVQFIFGQLDSDTGSKDGMEYTYFDGMQISQEAPSGWYLREVRSHDDKDVISYNYTPQKYAYKNLSSCSLSYYTTSSGTGSSPINCNGIPIAGATHKKVITHKIDGFRLSSIDCSVGSIDFMATVDREDVDPFSPSDPMAKRLERIEINDGAFCKAFDFDYSYPASLSGGTTSEHKRLRLENVQEISCNNVLSKPPYVFEYIAGALPDRYSKAIDHWGYYNGQFTNENKLNIPPVSVLWKGSFFSPPSANANREPSFDFAKRGTLSKLIYPHGGYTEFTFESNQAESFISISRIGTSIYEPLTNCINATDSDCCKVEKRQQTMSFTKEQLADANYELKAFTASICDTKSDFIIKVSVQEVGKEQILGTISFNSCRLEECSIIEPLSELASLQADVQYVFSLELSASTPTTNIAKASFSILDDATARAANSTKTIGGLRIKEWRKHDGINSANDIVRTFDYTENENSIESSGFLFIEPRYYGYQRTHDGNAVGLTFSATSVAPLANFNGYTVGYRRVVEQTNGSGKTEYIFNAESVIPDISSDYPYTPQMLRAEDGVELKSTVFNESNQELAKKQTFRYTGVGYETLSDHIIYKAFQFGTPTGSILYGKSYDIRTGVYLAGEVRSELDGVETITTYDYDPTNHLAPTLIKTTNSDGIEYLTENDYVFDYPSANSVYQELMDRNIIQPVLESRQKIIKNGLTTQIGGTRNNFAAFNKTTGFLTGLCCANSDPYPNQIFHYEMTWDENGAVVLGDSDGWVVETTYLKYDLNTAKPTSVFPHGWSAQTYSYDLTSKQLTSSQFLDHEKTFSYYTGSSKLKEVTEIDGQVDVYEWDDLMRPKKITDRNGAIIHNYQYGYKENGDAENFFKTTTDYTGASNSALRQIEVINYKDGLNRVIQQVQRKHSANQLDVITGMTYDNQGRPSKTYEPFESTTGTGAKKTIPSNTPFTLNSYEPSPLHRQSAITPPYWHTSTMTYGANTTAIKDYFNDANFAIGSLNTQTTTDGNGNKTTSFTDKLGRTVLTQRSNSSGSSTNNTYTAFDPKSRPVLILPPTTHTYPSTSVSNLIYTYQYNHLDQIIEQKIPDKEKIETVYHPDRDYPVAYRDGNLRNNNQWMVTAYDNFGRPIQTGLVNASSIANPSNVVPSEIWTKTFYDGQVGATLPTQRNIYNDLPQDLQGLFPPAARNVPAPADRTNIAIYKGKVHYTETATLNGNTASPAHKRLFTTYAYDQFGRIMHLGEDNHLGGYDLTAFFYNHQDNVTRTLRSHRFDHDNSPDFSNYVNNHYDHQGRDIAQYFNILGHSSHQICGKTYTAKDQIASKSLGKTATGFLQEVNYDYLPNGFLSGINTETADPADLFHLDINYHQPSSFGTSAPSQYNGNISQLTWWGTNTNNKQSYGYTYDYLDRLTSAKYGTLNLNNQLNPTGDYDTNYAYDERGNIIELDRTGMVSVNNVLMKQDMDKLRFTPVPNSNQIATIIDASTGSDSGLPPVLNVPGAINSDSYEATVSIISNGQTIDNSDVTFRAGQDITLTPGFETKGEFLAIIQAPSNPAGFAQTSEDSYLYDENGNMIRDPNKGIDIAYNYLNLPYQVTYDNGNKIEWLYDANGKKWQKQTSGTETVKQDYLNDVEYKGGVLEAIYLEDARVVFDNGSFDGFQYFLPDHLGNNRVVFKDNGSGQAEVVQESHFYPFGMNMQGSWAQNNNPDPDNNYLYNGKELDTDFGLDWYHYGARMYDPQIGRFTGVDPLASDFTSWSPYNYTYNNPIRFIDPDGMSPDDIIIGNKDQETQYEVLSQLRQLTNDELAIQGGKVVITSRGTANEGKNLSEGTQLIADLIEDNNTTTVSINPSRNNGTTAINPKTKKPLRVEAQENTEYDARVSIKGNNPNTVNADGSRGVNGGSFITLGHELQHARDLTTGNYDRSVILSAYDHDTNSIMNKGGDSEFSVREYNTRVFENKIRNENNIKPRALPIPLIPLSILKP